MGKKFDSNGHMLYIYNHNHMPLVLNPTPPVIPANLRPSATLRDAIEEMKRHFTEKQIVEDLHENFAWSYQEIQERTGLL